MPGVPIPPGWNAICETCEELRPVLGNLFEMVRRLSADFPSSSTLEIGLSLFDSGTDSAVSCAT